MCKEGSPPQSQSPGFLRLSLSVGVGSALLSLPTHSCRRITRAAQARHIVWNNDAYRISHNKNNFPPLPLHPYTKRTHHNQPLCLSSKGAKKPHDPAAPPPLHPLLFSPRGRAIQRISLGPRLACLDRSRRGGTEMGLLSVVPNHGTNMRKSTKPGVGGGELMFRRPHYNSSLSLFWWWKRKEMGLSSRCCVRAPCGEIQYENRIERFSLSPFLREWLPISRPEKGELWLLSKEKGVVYSLTEKGLTDVAFSVPSILCMRARVVYYSGAARKKINYFLLGPVGCRRKAERNSPAALKFCPLPTHAAEHTFSSLPKSLSGDLIPLRRGEKKGE